MTARTNGNIDLAIRCQTIISMAEQSERTGEMLYFRRGHALPFNGKRQEGRDDDLRHTGLAVSTSGQRSESGSRLAGSRFLYFSADARERVTLRPAVAVQESAAQAAKSRLGELDATYRSCSN